MIDWLLLTGGDRAKYARAAILLLIMLALMLALGTTPDHH